MPRCREEESPASLVNSFSAFRRNTEDDEALDYAGSPTQISAAPIADVASASETGEEEDDEFAFVPIDPDSVPRITADEIFSNGQIRSIYPVFDRGLVLDSSHEQRTLRRLLIEERETTAAEIFPSSSGVDELEGIPEGTYCVWNPRSSARSPERCGKSGSTGTSRRWRIRDLVVRRSQSDGKERFVFLAEVGGKMKGKEKGKDEVEVEAGTARGAFHGRKGMGEAAKAATGGRKSFLPYKLDILGLISNANAVSRIRHPF